MTTTEKEKVKGFCDLLEFLHAKHAKWAGGDPGDDKQKQLNSRVIGTGAFGVVRPEKLQFMTANVVRKGGHLDLDAKELVFLKPPPKEILLPALSLRSNFGSSSLKVAMALFTFDGAKLASVGFRFETPEDGDSHVFHHAQMIRYFQKNTPPELPGVPPWCPVTIPAFPLSARTPVSLFLSILVSLYGIEHLAREWRGHKFAGTLAADIADLKSGCGHC